MNPRGPDGHTARMSHVAAEATGAEASSRRVPDAPGGPEQRISNTPWAHRELQPSAGRAVAKSARAAFLPRRRGHRWKRRPCWQESLAPCGETRAAVTTAQTRTLS
jgi:hypothetical protein